MKTHHLIYTLAFLLSATATYAQVAEEMPAPPFIKTVQFSAGGSRQAQLPIIRLGAGIEINFDDIIGDEADYFYKITHHNADWTPSDLARSEFMDGMDNVRILDYENSVAVLQLYTHYRLRIPNKNLRRLKKTGNYLLSIYNEDQELIFSRKFMIYSPALSVGAQIKRSRDLSLVNSKQVVRFFIDGGDDPLINPNNTVHTVILQNNNLNTAITGIKPQYTIGNRLEYRYDKETSFWAGNEYFGFENKDIRAATAAVQRIALKNLYHNYLFTNPSRIDRPYTYNPDINGNFVITTLQGRNPDSEAEYVWVHFSVLESKVKEGQEMHVYGNFNNYVTDETTKMKWNENSGRYTHPMLLKQGFYNYKFVIEEEDGSINPNIQPSGNYWQTENEYQILVYYRFPGGRFDELLGYGTTNSTGITN
ncbi:MAG: hypothetical protein ACI828_001096 [Flavobacteriales bacterium]|jgi:hypothetical protein